MNATIENTRERDDEARLLARVYALILSFENDDANDDAKASDEKRDAIKEDAPRGGGER